MVSYLKIIVVDKSSNSLLVHRRTTHHSTVKNEDIEWTYSAFSSLHHLRKEEDGNDKHQNELLK